MTPDLWAISFCYLEEMAELMEPVSLKTIPKYLYWEQSGKP